MSEEFNEGEALTLTTDDEVVSTVIYEQSDGEGHAIVQEENSGYRYIVPLESLTELPDNIEQ